MRRADPQVVEAVCEDDWLWFERHEGEIERIRPYVDGEAPLEPPPAGFDWVTVVRLVAPGARVRSFLVALHVGSLS